MGNQVGNSGPDHMGTVVLPAPAGLFLAGAACLYGSADTLGQDQAPGSPAEPWGGWGSVAAFSAASCDPGRWAVRVGQGWHWKQRAGSGQSCLHASSFFTRTAPVDAWLSFPTSGEQGEQIPAAPPQAAGHMRDSAGRRQGEGKHLTQGYVLSEMSTAVWMMLVCLFMANVHALQTGLKKQVTFTGLHLSGGGLFWPKLKVLHPAERSLLVRETCQLPSQLLFLNGCSWKKCLDVVMSQEKDHFLHMFYLIWLAVVSVN